MKTATQAAPHKKSDVMTVPRILSETGMLAASMGNQDYAEKIFGALRILKPESDLPVVGIALSLMNGGKWEKAIALLAKAHLHEHQESDAIRCFLALALHCGGRRQEAMRMVEMLHKEGKEPWALAMADALAGIKDA